MKNMFNGFGQNWHKKRSLKIVSIVVGAVVAVGLVAFLVIQTRAWHGTVGEPTIFPTENPPINMSNDLRPSKTTSIASDPNNTQNIYAVWAFQDPSSTLYWCIKYSESSNSGRTWSAPTSVSCSGEDQNLPHEKPDIAVSYHNSTLRRHITYRNSAGNIKYWYTNNGSNFFGNTIVGSGDDPAIAALSDTVVIVWDENNIAKSRKSSDWGVNWDTIQTLPGQHVVSSDPDVAVDTEGNWAVSYLAFGGDGDCWHRQTILRGVTSTDGETWGNQIDLDQLCDGINTSSIFKPAIAALPFRSGNFYTAYQFYIQTAVNPFMAIKAVSWTSGAVVTAPTIISGTDVQAINPAITSDVNGYVHTFWQSVTSQ